MAQPASVIPITQAIMPDEFWEAWRNMDEKGRTAYIMGGLNQIHTRLNELESKVEDVIYELEPRDPY